MCIIQQYDTIRKRKMKKLTKKLSILNAYINFKLSKVSNFRQPIIIAISLIVMGIILYLVDKKAKSNTNYENMNFKQSFLIGLSQCLAFVPGVSRSGITMTVGRAMGVDRESVAKYSFMLSTPIVFAASMLKLIEGEFIFSIPFFIGVFTSFIVGIIVIKWLLNYLKKGSFKIFAIYRMIFGIIILILAFVRI